MMGFHLGGFDNAADPLKFGMLDQTPKALQADKTLANVLMTIDSAGQGLFGIIEMQQFQAIQPYLLAKVIQGIMKASLCVDGVAAGQDVAGV